MCYRNANMKAYLGETKFKMLEEFGAIREKYGAQPTKCENVFQSVCPWDSVGMSSIFMKLMVSRKYFESFRVLIRKLSYAIKNQQMAI